MDERFRRQTGNRLDSPHAVWDPADYVLRLVWQGGNLCDCQWYDLALIWQHCCETGLKHCAWVFQQWPKRIADSFGQHKATCVQSTRHLACVLEWPSGLRCSVQLEVSRVLQSWFRRLSHPLCWSLALISYWNPLLHLKKKRTHWSREVQATDCDNHCLWKPFFFSAHVKLFQFFQWN